jgi:hypothetical protein
MRRRAMRCSRCGASSPSATVPPASHVPPTTDPTRPTSAGTSCAMACMRRPATRAGWGAGGPGGRRPTSAPGYRPACWWWMSRCGQSDGPGLPGDDADDARSCHRGPGRTDRPRNGSCRKPVARRRGMDRDRGWISPWRCLLPLRENFLYTFKAGQRAASGRPRPATPRRVPGCLDGPCGARHYDHMWSLPAPFTVVPGFRRCGCCGGVLPRRSLTELASTAGVFICRDCARFAAMRTRGRRGRR